MIMEDRERNATGPNGQVPSISPVLRSLLVGLPFPPLHKLMSANRENQIDAFSQTLESRPRQRTRLTTAPTSHNHAIPSSHKDGAVNRLSRVFEQESERRHVAGNNIRTPAVSNHQKPAANAPPVRPALPTKPPSLRISSNFQRQPETLPSPSSESVTSPVSIATVDSSVTSFASDVPSSHRPSWTKDYETESVEQSPSGNDKPSSNIDQTPLAFHDIRARFQQAQQEETPPVSSQSTLISFRVFLSAIFNMQRP